ALDVEPPVISFDEGFDGGTRTITIGAADYQSGIKTIHYSLDGLNYQPYTGPFNPDGCQIRTIYAFADDNIGNRSEVFTYELPNLPPMVTNATSSIPILWPPNHRMVEESIIGVTDPDCDPVSITITRITQDEPTNGAGDGSTCPDATGVGSSAAQVR